MEKELTQEKKIKEMFKVFFDLKESKNYKGLMDLKDKILKDGIIFCGVGKNWYICEKVTKTFLSMGIPAQALDPVHALHGDLGMIRNQVVVFVSRSGTTEELLNLARVLQGIKKNNLCGEVVLVGMFLLGCVLFKISKYLLTVTLVMKKLQLILHKHLASRSCYGHHLMMNTMLTDCALRIHNADCLVYPVRCRDIIFLSLICLVAV